ncbi:MAG: MFS transporter [Clostridia bacterium]|nr:MFS transporter [Clostridia bacterium]
MSETKPRRFYGWIVVLGCALMMGTSVGLFVNCNGVFVKPVCEDLGFSRGAFTLYSTIINFLGMLMQLYYGNLYRTRRILPIARVAAVVTCASMVGFSFASKLWHFYALATIFGLSQVPVSMLTIATLVNNWFVDKKGLAAGLAYCGSGVTAAIMTPVLTAVVADHGWRSGYRLLGVLGFVLLFVAVFLLLREKPADMGLLPLGVSADAADGSAADATPAQAAVGLTRAEALKTPVLYMMVFSFAVFTFCNMGMMNHLISYFTDIGYSEGYASTIVSLVMTVMIGAKILMGAIFDRVGALWTAALTGSFLVCSLLMLTFAGASPVIPFVFACFYGFGSSTGTVPLNFLLTENFGSRDFAALYSLVSMMSGIFSSLGPSLVGAMYDLLGSYSRIWPGLLALVCLAAVTLVTATLMASRRNYNPAAIHKRKG